MSGDEWDVSEGGLLLPKPKQEEKVDVSNGFAVRWKMEMPFPIGGITPLSESSAKEFRDAFHSVLYDDDDEWTELDEECSTITDLLAEPEDGAGRGPGHIVFEDYNFTIGCVAHVLLEYCAWFLMNEEQRRSVYPDYHNDEYRVAEEIKALHSIRGLIEKYKESE